MRNLISRFIILAIVIALASSARGQDASVLTGVATDSSGAVVPAVTVTLIDTTTGNTYAATTNAAGSYTIANVAPGPGYKVAFSHSGFEKFEVSDVYMNVATTRTLNARLQIGSVSQQIEVSAGSEDVTLNTTDATIGNNYNVSLLNDLPVQERSTPATLFTLQPGVTLDGSTTGARVDQNNVTLDGLDVNDIATGNAFAIVGNAPVDSVQEFRGTVAGNLANSGPGGGGQFQLVTKSGTNTFHGNLNEYHRDTSTVANDWFNNNAGVPRAPLIRNQFGGNIGGPVKKDKLFFFFDYNNSRIVQSTQVIRTVPLDSFRAGNIAYINDGNGCTGSSRLSTTPTCISSLTPTQVAALDPQGIGFNSAILALIGARYPHANDLSGGDGINTGNFHFNAPDPDFLTSYVGRFDYNLNSSMKVFGRFTIARENATESSVQFPGDPVTSPFVDRSYAWVVGHTWTIGQNKVNQAFYGTTVSDYSFLNSYNPQGLNILGFSNGITDPISDPYSSPVNAQARRIPIPVIGDDFTWQKGSHSLDFGGTFKYITSYSITKLDYNQVTLGLGGNLQNLNSSLEPADLLSGGTDGATAETLFDSNFALALGRVASISSGYNYNSAGAAIPQGTGDIRHYRYYQTQVYAGDTWKVNPSLTLSYGLNYQYFSVPYETNGLESVEQYSFDKYFAVREAQSAAAESGASVVPFITYVLGGKANHGPSLYSPSWKDLAPRFAFAYSPNFDRKSVFNGGAGIVYDRTVINAVQYQQDQHSYLFQQNLNTPYGNSTDANGSLLNDPRLGSGNSVPAIPAPSPIKAPYSPFVVDGVPMGLANGQEFNTIIDPTLKTPYSIAINFGFQHEFAGGFILKTNYVGRLGRRLLGQADANQLVDFPDHASGQLYSTAFGNLTQQIRAGINPANVTPQPWFENVVTPGIGQQLGFNSNSALLASFLNSFVSNGDFGDFTQALAANGLVDYNVGMASQFSENTFYTNKGFSTYNGLLTSLQKNLSRGLHFDLNYTWSHSIDNVSLVANQGAAGGYGFICDARNIRICRGNSDFDVANYISGDFTYDLPFGRGQTFGPDMPRWANEVVGGWQVSGITSWHSGVAYSTASNAYVAGYANDAPAIFNGDRGAIATHPHKSADGSVNIFANQTDALSAFSGPVGFTIGSRNNLRGPRYFNQDLGLAKTFPIIEDKVNLKFRTDAFNAFNHPSFDIPGVDHNNLGSPNGQVTITSGSIFGQINSTASDPRVLQFSLRLEF
jgi:hypothetical protein